MNTDIIWGILAGFLVQLGVVIFGYGKLTQKVADLSKKIDNGWTCKAHTELAERIAKAEARAEAKTER